jgi:Leucine-rich repeat (LRR) protein
MHSNAVPNSSTQDALHLVLQHLSSPEGNPRTYNQVARGLHRTSKQHQAAARATLRHLHLDSYYEGLLGTYPSPIDRPPAVPWDLLAACPAVTSWTLHPEQLVCFQDPLWSLDDEVAAAVCRLKQLSVHDVHCVCEQQEGLGRLLWACQQLEHVDITYSGIHQPQFLKDPDHISSAIGPPLPAMRSWSSKGFPGHYVLDWLVQQQEQQASSTLRALSLNDNSRDVTTLDGRQLTALTGLRDLDINSYSLLLPLELGAMSHLTKLALPTNTTRVRPVCAITGLRDLSFKASSYIRELPSCVSTLQQLTSLELDRGTSSLPPELGSWHPRLQRLVGLECTLGTVPTSLTALTCLHLHGNRALQLTLPSTLASLRELRLSGSSASMSGLHHLTGMEVLHAGLPNAVDSLTILQPLTRLRHLSLVWAVGWDGGSFTAVGSLQRLTFLAVGGTSRSRVGARWPTSAFCDAVGLTARLPALEQLSITCLDARSVAALGPWVAQHTTLTRLVLAGSEVDADSSQLLWLPAQLQELALSHMELQQLPSGVAQLSSLVFLCIAANPLKQLPAWLTGLRRLEVLDAVETCIHTEQQVLAQMPLLRCVRVGRYKAAAGPMPVGPVSDVDFGRGAVPGVVFGKAAHLHFRRKSRFALPGYTTW